jgi:trehalose utilization protein
MILKENSRHFDVRYNVRAVEEVSTVSNYNGNTILKGSLAVDKKSGEINFVKTFYELRPAYCVSRVNRA